jgi:Arc/MetJ-type ribon-helix-helix transcriptional regulator
VEIIAWVDEMVEKGRYASRSEAIGLLLEQKRREMGRRRKEG